VYPRISVEGGARERGRRHGEAVRERVRRSVDAYAEVFAHHAGWDRARVRAAAAGFRAPIAAHGAKYLEELYGIAEGAHVDELDVLAINVRTEIMFCHPDPRAASAPERYATVMALIMDPAARRIWLASGNPCESPFELLDYADFLSPPSVPAAPSNSSTGLGPVTARAAPGEAAAG